MRFAQTSLARRNFLLPSAKRNRVLPSFNAAIARPINMLSHGHKKKQASTHPYLTGNFAPVTQTTSPIPIRYSGVIPKELHGGMYVRNGGNPISNSDLGREAHWFDGDGMLTGVWFDRSPSASEESSPHFVNQFVLTDLCLSSFENKRLQTPILPSIATLVNPFARLVVIVWSILRSVILVLLSHLPGSLTAIKRISVANTGILYHDGRALATCESGPPIRVQLPGLDTVGWFDGNSADGEPEKEQGVHQSGFGGTGLNSWMREWTTGHPKVDPATGEMMLFHCNFLPPFVHYSLVPRESQQTGLATSESPKMLNAPISGCSGGKMMHDFGVSKHHTVILDLPLTLSPFNLMRNKPVVAYEPEKPSRFGVFPRREPHKVLWYETTGCCIFHTANTWDEYDVANNAVAVDMLVCRLTSASLVFSAGNITPPPHPKRQTEVEQRPMSFFAKYDEDDELKDVEKIPSEDEERPLLSREQKLYSSGPPIPPISDDDEEQCRLYYYRFDFSSSSSNEISHQYALSKIPFEFPTVNPSKEMSFARYIYGCSTSNASFGAALGKATKIDVIVKMDVHTLLERGRRCPPESVTGCVDTRSIKQVIQSTDLPDPIKAFKLPPNHYAQEARFLSKQDATSEDDGYLMFYVFDESQLDAAGECSEDAMSDLWVLDARDMQTVVCKVHLPARVPYGLHGNWFSEEQIQGQRAVEKTRMIPEKRERTAWVRTKERLIEMLR